MVLRSFKKFLVVFPYDRLGSLPLGLAVPVLVAEDELEDLYHEIEDRELLFKSDHEFR